MSNNFFKDFVLEQLANLNSIECKRMFDGFGLYYEGKFFAIIHQGSLFFKTNLLTQKKYSQMGMKPFSPSPKQVLKNYYEVPPEILETPIDLCAWAKEAASLAK